MNATESSPKPKFRQATPIVILSVPFDMVSMAQTLALVEQMIASRRPHYMIMADVDFAVRAMKDVEVRRILLEAHLVLCDGTPIQWASRWLGNPLPERIAAPDLVPALLGAAEEKGWRVFFLGSKEETLVRAREKLRVQHPRLQVAGHLSPPASVEAMDHAAICRTIRDAKSDILLVAFGSPDQEQWVNTRYRAAGVPVTVGVGDAMDFVAGVAPRAPMWMQRAGLEWLFRMTREPRRLCLRYLADLWVFTGEILGQWWRLQVRRRRVAKYRRLMVVAEKTESGYEMVKIPPRFDAAVVREHEWLWKCFAASPVHLLLDMTHVQFIDSTGIGLLIRLHKLLVAAGCRFVLVSPSRIAQESLERVRVPDLLTIVPGLDAAKDVIAGRPGGVQAAATLDLSPGPTPLMWHGEIMASNVAAVQHLSESYLESCAAEARRCVVDMSGVSFISSAGVGLMGRLKKLGRMRGVEVNFINPQHNVLKVIQTFRLDKLLFGESA